MIYTPIDLLSEVPTTLMLDDVEFDVYRLTTEIEKERGDRCTLIRFATKAPDAILLLNESFLERVPLTIGLAGIARRAHP